MSNFAAFTLPVRVNGGQALHMAFSQVFPAAEGAKIVQDDIDGRMAFHHGFRRAKTQEIEMEVETAFRNLNIPDFLEAESHPDLDGKFGLTEGEVDDLKKEGKYDGPYTANLS